MVAYLSPVQVEVSTLIMAILSDLCWDSECGFDVAMAALAYFMAKKELYYLFEPFIRVLYNQISDD